MENTFGNKSFIAIGDDPRHPSHIITGETPSDAHLVAVAKVVIASTQLEEEVLGVF